MRIAFAGKGGAGKTTLAALFSLHAAALKARPVLAIDADINMHLAPLLGLGGSAAPCALLSQPESALFIASRLMGTNPRIKSAAHFKKTTPPGRGSILFRPDDGNDAIMRQMAAGPFPLRLMVVGTYDENGIGTSCYHNNLAPLENILSHMKDGDTAVAVDMVAGTDAFANTLHAQFDLIVLAVEPTVRGVAVFSQYRALARAAGVEDRLAVVGNKVRSPEERDFLDENIPPDKLAGFLEESDYLRRMDREGGALDIAGLEPRNAAVLETLWQRLRASRVSPDERYKKLLELHRAYAAQPHVRERFGDLSGQIDPNFRFEP
jgi:CO dehydrogenase maturation factor